MLALPYPGSATVALVLILYPFGSSADDGVVGALNGVVGALTCVLVD